MIQFTASGHKNLLATHKNTLEFTKDKDITLNGDCIVGVNSDFNSSELKRFVKGHEDFLLTIQVKSHSFSITGKTNPDFKDERELVLRLGEFASERTFGVKCDKSAIMIPRDMVELMKNPNCKITVSIKNQVHQK